MIAAAHWCIIFEAEMPFVQSSINQSDKSLKTKRSLQGNETSAPTVSSQWVFFSCLLTIQCVSQLFVFHLFIHTVTLMSVLVFHHERTLSPPISQIELATCHTLLRPQCNIFTTCLTCRRLESSVKINYWCPPRLTRRAVCALVLSVVIWLVPSICWSTELAVVPSPPVTLQQRWLGCFIFQHRPSKPKIQGYLASREEILKQNHMSWHKHWWTV